MLIKPTSGKLVLQLKLEARIRAASHVLQFKLNSAGNSVPDKITSNRSQKVSPSRYFLEIALQKIYYCFSDNPRDK